MKDKPNMKQPQPLKGIRVLDLTYSYSGPFCTMFLADMGAEVIKVEEPRRGDDSRYWGPPFAANGISPWFWSVNRSKKSIAINMQDQRGLDIVKNLVPKVDVLVVSLGVKAMAKLGLTYYEMSTLNPGLIYCSITGFGNDGPYKNRLAYDLVSEGIGGIMSVTGDNNEPQKVGTAAGDILAAHQACFAIACCLHRRNATGKGEFLDICLVDSIISFVTPRMVTYLATGEVPQPDANRSSPIAIYQPIPTKDSYLNMGIGNDRIWSRACKLLGLEDLLEHEDYQSNESRRAHREEIVTRLSAVLQTRETRYWFEYLSEGGVPCGPIYYLDQVASDPQVQFRRMLFELDGGPQGRVPQVAPPWKLGNTEEPEYGVPPEIGADTQKVLSKLLEMDAAVLEELRSERVIK